jgi:hypothetical protein
MFEGAPVRGIGALGTLPASPVEGEVWAGGWRGIVPRLSWFDGLTMRPTGRSWALSPPVVGIVLQ